MIDVVLFHTNCSDGITSAWLLSKYIKPKPFMIPVQYGDPVPSKLQGKTVMIVDFSFSQEEIIHLTSICKQVILRDHHATSDSRLSKLTIDNLDLIIDQSKCGAQLTIDYLSTKFPPDSMINPGYHDRPVYHWLIELVKDRDLWLWENKWSRVVYDYMAFHGHFKSISSLNRFMLLDITYESMIEEGTRINKENNDRLDSIISKARKAKLMDHEIIVCECSAKDKSDIGDRLSSGEIFCLAYTIYKGIYYVSLRSSKTCSIDLSKISEKYGGGGHFRAAGFITNNLDTLLTWL